MGVLDLALPRSWPELVFQFGAPEPRSCSVGPASLQTRPEGLGSAPSAAASLGQARRWPGQEACEAPMEVSRHQLSEHVATKEVVCLSETNTFLHGEVVSAGLDGGRSRIHHDLPSFACGVPSACNGADQVA